MTPLPQSQIHAPPVGLPSAPQGAARPSRLLSAIYHDIGMAAVAVGLELAPETLEPEAHEAVKRGSRYIYLMPKRQDSSLAPAAA